MVIFDLDGTLVDSQPEIVAAFEGAWREVLPERAFPRERIVIGPPLDEMVKAVCPDAEKRRPLVDAFRRRYDASDFSRTMPYPGVHELLDALASRKVPLGLATNKRLPPTLAIARRWFPGKFARIACSDGVFPDDGTRPSSKRAMIEWLAQGRRAVMVGDTPADVEAARAAGLPAVAVTWGYGDPRALTAARPDATIDAPGQLAGLDFS